MVKIKYYLWLFVLGIVSLILRARGLLEHGGPFWIDEFSSARQAIILKKFGVLELANQNIGLDLHNALTHLLIAVSFVIFGVHEWSARLPFVLIGSLVPIALYLLTRNLFTVPIAIAATLLTTFSYFMITWSRQARGYVLQQLLVIAAIYLYFRLLKKTSYGLVIAFFSVSLLGVLTHFMFFILLGVFFIHYFLFRNKDFVANILKNKFTYIFLASFTFVLYALGFFTIVTEVIISSLFKTNNLWYYHSFLWREYGLFTFLGIVGLFLALPKAKQSVSLILLYIGAQILFVSFVWPPYTSRYLLPIIPLLFIGSALSINALCLEFAGQIPKFKKYLQFILPITLTLAIIANGHKFTLKPQVYYSVNHDFREIALIDYRLVYDLIKSKGELEKNQTAVIDTWHDRLYWYLGADFPNTYLFRWIDEPGLVNGLTKKTNYKLNSIGEKVIPDTNNLRFIGELKDLKMAMKKYPKGFIFIDDASLPKDVLDYVEANFKKELYLDHYPLDDNPYSIWPATLYSWGIK